MTGDFLSSVIVSTSLVTKKVEEGDKDDHEEVCVNSGESRRDRHPFVFFENSEKKLFSVHKCVVADKKSDLTDSQLVSLVPKAASERLQVLIAISHVQRSTTTSKPHFTVGRVHAGWGTFCWSSVPRR